MIKQNNFKNILFTLTILLLSSCTLRDYHLFRLRDSMITSNQIEHIEAIKKIDNDENENIKKRYSYCKSYGLGYGAFTLNCNL